LAPAPQLFLKVVACGGILLHLRRDKIYDWGRAKLRRTQVQITRLVKEEDVNQGNSD
jgi:hypothetical protein